MGGYSKGRKAVQTEAKGIGQSGHPKTPSRKPNSSDHLDLESHQSTGVDSIATSESNQHTIPKSSNGAGRSSSAGQLTDTNEVEDKNTVAVESEDTAQVKKQKKTRESKKSKPLRRRAGSRMRRRVRTLLVYRQHRRWR